MNFSVILFTFFRNTRPLHPLLIENVLQVEKLSVSHEFQSMFTANLFDGWIVIAHRHWEKYCSHTTHSVWIFYSYNMYLFSDRNIQNVLCSVSTELYYISSSPYPTVSSVWFALKCRNNRTFWFLEIQTDL